LGIIKKRDNAFKKQFFSIVVVIKRNMVLIINKNNKKGLKENQMKFYKRVYKRKAGRAT